MSIGKDATRPLLSYVALLSLFYILLEVVCLPIMPPFTVKRLFFISFCVSLISPLAFDAPLATSVWKGFQLEQQGWTLKPTEAPSMQELRRRQNTQYLLLEPDGTCGYISGSSGIF